MTGIADTSAPEPSLPWFEEWFSHPLYLQVYSHRDRDEAARCIHTVLSLTALEHKDPAAVSVLDIACGAGRHALELARLGYSVTGNDLSPFLLEEARKEALQCGLQVKLTCCDMRRIAADPLFDLVVQLFTSFGYFDLREDDRLVVRRVYDSLKSGGWYVLDLINPVHLRRNLVSSSSRTSGKLTLLEERAIVDGRITKNITITSPGGETLSFSESVRLYSRSGILAVLHDAGFSVTGIAGDYQGTLFSEEDSPRMMLFCRKP